LDLGGGGGARDGQEQRDRNERAFEPTMPEHRPNMAELPWRARFRSPLDLRAC
jgi:hypothetical protein